MYLKENWRACLCGAAAGIANGLLGAGGGMLLVPLLQKLCHLEDRQCFSTALSVIFPLTVVSIIVYCMHGIMPFHSSIPYLVSGFLGGLGGGLMMKKTPTNWLHWALGVLMLWGGGRLLLE